MKEVGGVLLITADHGNAEINVDQVTGEPHTSHTTSPVPFVLLGTEAKSVHDGSLADLAPTILALLGLSVPQTMTGRPLFD
jgi:2,3-bisphosphoglycerate-independent phosphoglycerate mutase